jgi:hypothetical protein
MAGSGIAFEQAQEKAVASRISDGGKAPTHWDTFRLSPLLPQ